MGMNPFTLNTHNYLHGHGERQWWNGASSQWCQWCQSPNAARMWCRNLCWSTTEYPQHMLLLTLKSSQGPESNSMPFTTENTCFDSGCHQIFTRFLILRIWTDYALYMRRVIDCIQLKYLCIHTYFTQWLGRWPKWSSHFALTLEQRQYNKIIVCCVGVPKKIGWDYVNTSCKKMHNVWTNAH